MNINDDLKLASLISLREDLALLEQIMWAKGTYSLTRLTKKCLNHFDATHPEVVQKMDQLGLLSKKDAK